MALSLQYGEDQSGGDSSGGTLGKGIEPIRDAAGGRLFADTVGVCHLPAHRSSRALLSRGGHCRPFGMSALLSTS